MPDEIVAEVAIGRPPAPMLTPPLSPLGLSQRPNGVKSLKSREPRLGVLLPLLLGCETELVLCSINIGLAVTRRRRGKGCGFDSDIEEGWGRCKAASGGTEPDLESRPSLPAPPLPVKSILVLRFRLTGGLICSDFSKVLARGLRGPAVTVVAPVPTRGC